MSRHLADSKGSNMSTIGVIGAGAWGTALSVHLARMGHGVKLWAYEKELVGIINQKRTNALYLPDITIPDSVSPTSEIADACEAEIIAIVCPSRFFRNITKQAVVHLPSSAPIAIFTKGVEDDRLLFPAEVMVELLPKNETDRVAVISGPSFAREVADGYPTDVVVASKNREVALKIQKEFHTPFFRVYTSDDVMGVQVGGATKNVIAIASGGCDGLGLGLNARAALITRGLAEITRLGVAKGANPLTFLGLAGMGDLVLTCTGDLSRNRTFGKRVAKGELPKAVIESTNAVVEGYYAARAIYRLAQKLNVDMPITEQVYLVLYENKSIQDALKDLLRREFKDELKGITYR